MSHRRFHPVEVHEFPLRKQVVPDPMVAQTSAVLITDAAPFARILTRIGERPRAPPIARARGPPAWDDAPEPVPDWDLLAQPAPGFEFYQRVSG